jgi:hypothetical protein
MRPSDVRWTKKKCKRALMGATRHKTSVVALMIPAHAVSGPVWLKLEYKRTLALQILFDRLESNIWRSSDAKNPQKRLHVLAELGLLSEKEEDRLDPPPQRVDGNEENP